MTTIVTRSAKGSALSWNEVDANFDNLNTDKLEVSTAASTYETQVHATATYAPITTTVTKDTNTGAINVPNGTTAERPTDAVAKVRYNSTLDSYEGYTTFYGWDSLTNGSTLKLGRSGVSTNNLIITSGTEPCVITNGDGTAIATLRPNVNEFAGSLRASGLTTNIYPCISIASTSIGTGTEYEFTNIPSWVTRITMLFANISGTSTGNLQVQLGNSGAYTTTGYTGTISQTPSGAVSTSAALSVAFTLSLTLTSASSLSGVLTLERMANSGDIWCATGQTGFASGSNICQVVGHVDTGILTRVKFKMSTGNFDAGTVSINYE